MRSQRGNCVAVALAVCMLGVTGIGLVGCRAASDTQAWMELNVPERSPVEQGSWLCNADPLNKLPRGMRKGAVARRLAQEGFSVPDPALREEDKWLVRRRWQGGYHFASITFRNGELQDVAEYWNDP